jgi:hypothetical protein
MNLVKHVLDFSRTQDLAFRIPAYPLLVFPPFEDFVSTTLSLPMGTKVLLSGLTYLAQRDLPIFHELIELLGMYAVGTKYPGQNHT